MNETQWSSAGSAPAVESTLVVALYEPKTGQIRHLHSVTVFRGAQRTDEAEAIEAAKQSAAKYHDDAAHLAVATSDDPRYLSPHRIDPSTGQFVPLTHPATMAGRHRR
ncbi:hypothetical protein F3087_33330 [Nocardia colli]|uniref:Uncharacterized protein n=1 Tax=Nocardia colli TaxID=2545717 RepID=A0A5N0E4Y2_9NOCA|nr:hypothetical protein [Nocardia colli]KAA8884487.1 hypothetical protein F3087_33330 [Nocardia colli]